jgi:hypothetical protein
MSPALLSGIASFLAVIACCMGGGLGGWVMARPDAALAAVGLEPQGDSRLGLSMARGYGGLLLLGHAGAAAALGYAPSVGAVLAFAMSLLWLGAAGGRLLSMRLDKPEPLAEDAPPPTPAPDAPYPAGLWSANRGLLSFDLLMAASLALPLWMLLAPTLRHTGVQV